MLLNKLIFILFTSLNVCQSTPTYFVHGPTKSNDSDVTGCYLRLQDLKGARPDFNIYQKTGKDHDYFLNIHTTTNNSFISRKFDGQEVLFKERWCIYFRTLPHLNPMQQCFRNSAWVYPDDSPSQLIVSKKPDLVTCFKEMHQVTRRAPLMPRKRDDRSLYIIIFILRICIDSF